MKIRFIEVSPKIEAWNSVFGNVQGQNHLPQKTFKTWRTVSGKGKEINYNGR